MCDGYQIIDPYEMEYEKDYKDPNQGPFTVEQILEFMKDPDFCWYVDLLDSEIEMMQREGYFV